jgi:hypothetical protein
MVVPLPVASWRSRVLLANWIAAWRAVSSQVEGAPTEVEAEAQAEAHAVKAWTLIVQLS